MADSEYLLVGLGNPGDKYENTRHNVGFLVIDELARLWGDSLATKKWDALSTRIRKWQCRLTLFKPMTYMNRSGKAVADVAKFYNIPPENIIVIHDDLDMHPGRLKLVKGGGAGGHNGIRSISQAIGSPDYFRLKIGIGRPGKNDVHPDFPVEQFVLSSMGKDEQQLLDDRISSIEEGISLLVLEGPGRAMSLINSIK